MKISKEDLPLSLLLLVKMVYFLFILLGNLDATGVRPRIGTGLLFRHGEGVDSLVHEGSNVIQGTKYIIRTDVLYKK
jgi:hypothetical protein